MKLSLIRTLSMLLIAVTLGACSVQPGAAATEPSDAAPADNTGRSPDWTDATHGDQAESMVIVIWLTLSWANTTA